MRKVKIITKNQTENSNPFQIIEFKPDKSLNADMTYCEDWELEDMPLGENYNIVLNTCTVRAFDNLIISEKFVAHNTLRVHIRNESGNPVVLSTLSYNIFKN